MKKWYLFYTNHASSEKLQRLIGELQSSINQERLKLQRPVGELVKQPVSETENDASNDFPIPFALVPWGQHIEIITRSESLEEALFYMQHVIDKGLSRTALVNCYKAHLFDHQGKIVNNFSTYLPEPQSHLVHALLLMNDNPQMTIEQALATVTYIAQETEVSGFRFSICRLDYVVL